MRKFSYDGLDRSISTLQQKLSDHENAIQKADIHDQNSVQGAVDAYEEVNDISKSLWDQFADLKLDYETGKINLARYKDHLLKFNQLLTGEKKIENKNLQAHKIAAEVKRFI